MRRDGKDEDEVGNGVDEVDEAEEEERRKWTRKKHRSNRPCYK